MTYYPAQGNNSVGQSSVLIKRRSRVQVPVALPILRCDVIGNIVGFDPILLGSSPSTSATTREKNVQKK